MKLIASKMRDWSKYALCIIQSQALSTPSYDAASVRLLKPSTAVTLMEVEKSSVFAPSPSHLISASPHHLCPGSMTTPTFLLARGAADAALDQARIALRAVS